MSDEQLHQAIRDARSGGRVAITVDLKAAIRAGSPSFRTTDIVVPWFAAIVLSAWLAASYGLVAGLALFIVAAGIIIGLLTPWNRRRAEDRTVGLALAGLEHWQTLWRMGGLILRRPDGETCRAPDGDWRGFARSLMAS